jgi:hypothetical protein
MRKIPQLYMLANPRTVCKKPEYKAILGSINCSRNSRTPCTVWKENNEIILLYLIGDIVYTD